MSQEFSWENEDFKAETDARATREQKAREVLLSRKRAYEHLFGNPDSPAHRAVMADLSVFCRAKTTCFDPCPRVHAAFEGRREVWQRIQDHLELSVDELIIKYGGVDAE